jgi:transposase
MTVFKTTAKIMDFIHIGIDISKKTLDLAVYAKEKQSEGILHVSNDKTGFKKILSWLKSLKLSTSKVWFCMEHTGEYGYALALFFDEVGITYSMVAGAEIKSANPSKKGKNDKQDAAMIARYAHEKRDSMTASHMNIRPLYELRCLLNERKMYVRQRAQWKTQRTEERVFSTKARDSRIKKTLKSLSVAIRDIENEMRAIIASDESLQRNFDLIMSVPGIGLVNAVNFIVATANFTAFSNARSYASHICVAPFSVTSGSSVNKGTHTTKIGRNDLKTELRTVVLAVLKADSEMREYFDRRRAEGKHFNVVANNIMFKLICRVFAVVNRGSAFVITHKYIQHSA